MAYTVIPMLYGESAYSAIPSKNTEKIHKELEWNYAGICSDEAMR